MNDELTKYYEARFTMMADKGWKDLIEDVEVMRDAADSLDGVDSEAKLNFRKGELSILNWLMSLEEVSKETFSKLKDEDATI